LFSIVMLDLKSNVTLRWRWKAL